MSLNPGGHREIVSDDEEMPPLEEAEDAQSRGFPLQRVSEIEREDAVEIEFFSPVYGCDFCRAVFAFEVDLIEHQNASAHHFCFQCDLMYSSLDALLQHLGDSRNHNFCFEFGLDFASPGALQAHLQSYPHASHCRCITLVLLSTVFVVLMGVLGAFMGGNLRY